MQIHERLATPEAAAEVLTHAEQVREELERIEREVGELGQQVASLTPSSDASAAAERALQASMLCALALARKFASLLSDAHIPLA